MKSTRCFFQYQYWHQQKLGDVAQQYFMLNANVGLLLNMTVLADDKLISMFTILIKG